MKKNRLLPLLLIAPMLASCGLTKPKEPKFVDVGKEVKADKFLEDLQKAYKKTSFAKDPLIDSGIFKSEEHTLTEIKRTGSVEGSSETINLEKYEGKFDKDNKLYKSVTEKQNQVKSEFSDNGTSESTSHDKEIDIYAQTKVGKKTYFVDIYEESKEYVKVSEITKENTLKDELDDLTKGFGEQMSGTLLSAIGTYSTLSEKDKKQYKFYENGNIFTIEMGKVTKTYKEPDNDNPIVVMELITSGKVQVDITEGKMKFAEWSVTEINYEFKQSYGDNVKGDKTENIVQTSTTASYEAKKVSLKAPDLSGYTRLGLDW